jgi:hypothetical protein
VAERGDDHFVVLAGAFGPGGRLPRVLQLVHGEADLDRA